MNGWVNKNYSCPASPSSQIRAFAISSHPTNSDPIYSAIFSLYFQPTKYHHQSRRSKFSGQHFRSQLTFSRLSYTAILQKLQRTITKLNNASISKHYNIFLNFFRNFCLKVYISRGGNHILPDILMNG